MKLQGIYFSINAGRLYVLLFQSKRALRKFPTSTVNPANPLSTKFPLHHSIEPMAPPISCINVSHTSLGDDGMDHFCRILSANTPSPKSIDLSFCSMKERGILSLCRLLHIRRRKGLAGLQGLILSGNTVSFKAAKELGNSLSPMQKKTIISAMMALPK